LIVLLLYLSCGNYVIVLQELSGLGNRKKLNAK